MSATSSTHPRPAAQSITLDPSTLQPEDRRALGALTAEGSPLSEGLRAFLDPILRLATDGKKVILFEGRGGEEYMSVAEAAEFTGLPESYILRRIERGLLKATFVGGDYSIGAEGVRDMKESREILDEIREIGYQNELGLPPRGTK